MRLIEPIAIELDKTRHMRLSLGALMAAEREINKLRAPEPRKSIFALIDKEMRGITNLEMSADFILVLLWASLLHEDSDLTIDQVAAMPCDMRVVIQKVLQVVGASFMDNEQPAAEVEDEEKKSNKKSRQTGANSGASAGSI